ncbi:IS110 family transposase [Rhodococcus yananensis]|uniref:IS110 family transposase n=1 Tax=Rhodococcus yananensis TaxID=2879464 RepID=UPI001CF8C569|nr:IS110 family transposase [Rhodococcus yananensis]
MIIIGDDWAEGHHDIEMMSPHGEVLTRFRVTEDVDGLEELLSEVHKYTTDDEVVVGIERDNGPWVTALRGYGFTVFAINPVQSARCRTRFSLAGAKSDIGDAHVLADMVRTDRQHLRQVAEDTLEAEGLKILTRTHKSLIWEHNRHLNRLRYNLIQYFPAALEAFPDLSSPESVELLTKAPTPSRAADLTITQIKAALRRAHRRSIDERAPKIRATLHAPGKLGLLGSLEAGHAAATVATLAVLATLTTQIEALKEQVTTAFADHPHAAIITSLPGMGPVLGARVLAEFGDAADRYRSGKARRNFAGTSPITKASGKKTVVSRRYVHNDRLLDALTRQAFTAIRVSPGARAYYDRQRRRGVEHNAALRHVANRFVGILHGCLKSGVLYDESVAWGAPARVDAMTERVDAA